jgi:hypothetical protein
MTPEFIFVTNLLGYIIRAGIPKEVVEFVEIPDISAKVTPEGDVTLCWIGIDVCRFNVFNGAVWINRDLPTFPDNVKELADNFLKLVYPMLYFGNIKQEKKRKK